MNTTPPTGPAPNLQPNQSARAAYAAYGTATGGLNHRGEPMPQWDDLPQQTRDAWTIAAGAVWDWTLRHVAERVTEKGEARGWSTWAAAYIHPDVAFVDPEPDPLRAAVEQALALFDGGPLTVRCCSCGSRPGDPCTGGGLPMRDPHQVRYRIQQTAALDLLREAVTQ